MRAVLFQNYGSADVLELREVDNPVPADDDVLIRIHAASINEWDWSMLRGVPFVNRVSAGLFRPKELILGADVAGTVEAVGTNVKRFRPGDQVFGDLCAKSGSRIPEYRGGAFAEFVCAPEDTLMRKPAAVTFEQAAALPQAGALAVQGLGGRDGVQAGMKVLVNGASGGTGTLAVQIAKTLGAEVTGVCRGAKMDLVRSLGADHVLDYQREDFTRTGVRYDWIVDVMGFHSLFDCRRALARNGRYRMLGGASGRVMQTMLLGPLLSRFSSKQMGVVMYKPMMGLDFLLELIEADRLRPVIDRQYPLTEIADAFRYYGDGNARGKVVIIPGTPD